MIKQHPYFFSIIILFGLLFVFVLLLDFSRELVDEKYGVIAVLKAEGALIESQSIVKQIKKIEGIDYVKGVVLRINSPGGGVAVAQEIYSALKRLNKKIPVYSSMGSVAASGGYYIACATKKIFANPGTITGSIGVLLEWINLEGLAENIGAKEVTITSGKNKASISPFRKIEPDQRQLLQNMVDDTHEQFIQAIVQGRKGSNEDKIRELADGRIFNGKQAKEFGLIDELADFEQVVRYLAKDLGLKVPVRTVDFKEDDFSDIFSSLNIINRVIPNWNSVKLQFILK